MARKLKVFLHVEEEDEDGDLHDMMMDEVLLTTDSEAKVRMATKAFQDLGKTIQKMVDAALFPEDDDGK